MSGKAKRKRENRKILLSDSEQAAVRKATGLEALELRLFRRFAKLDEKQISEIRFLIDLAIGRLDSYMVAIDKERQLNK